MSIGRVLPKDGVIPPRYFAIREFGPSRTKQSEAAACDINNIMAKYETTGIIAHANANPGFYADVSNLPDYAGAIAVVEMAEKAFMSLPAKVRERFHNDPQVWLDFVENPSNKAEMISMGLIEAPKPVAPVVPVVPVAPAAPAAPAVPAAAVVP